MLLKFFVKILALTLEKKIKNLSEPKTVHSTVLVFILDRKYRAKRNFSFLRFLQSKDKKQAYSVKFVIKKNCVVAANNWKNTVRLIKLCSVILYERRQILEGLYYILLTDTQITSVYFPSHCKFCTLSGNLYGYLFSEDEGLYFPLFSFSIDCID